MSPSPDRKSSTSSPRRHSRSPIGKRDSPNSKRVNGWQTFSQAAGGKPRHDYRTHRRNGSKGSKGSNTSHPTNSSGRPSHITDRGSLFYTKHIAFHGGVLSNFHRGKHFTGAAALKHLFPKLAELNITHPSIDSIATDIISHHKFVCGEQFMMAMKAYLFEMPTLDLAIETPDTLFNEYSTNLRTQLYSRDPESGPAGVPKSGERYFGLHKSVMMCILTTSNPKTMKDYGREVPNFNPGKWDNANMAIVTAVCLARAEADPDVADIYKANASSTTSDPTSLNSNASDPLKRHFVEGSPGDRIWGVGLAHYDNHIDDPNNWRGENRLGRCHDEACRLYNDANNEHKAHPVTSVAEATGTDDNNDNKNTKVSTEDPAPAEPALDGKNMEEGQKQKQDKWESKGDITNKLAIDNGSSKGGNKENKKNLGTWSKNPWADVRR